MAKHREPTDSQGHNLCCEKCGLEISISDSENWDKHVDAECSKK